MDMNGNYQWHLTQPDGYIAFAQKLAGQSILRQAGMVNFSAIFGIDTIENVAVFNNTTSAVSYFTTVAPLGCSTFSVDLGPDSILVCQSALNLTASTPYLSNVTFSWENLTTGEIYFTTSSQLPPISQIDQETIVVTAIDTSFSPPCWASDTAVVSSHTWVFDTIYLCSDSAVLDLGPGALDYMWIPMNDTTQSVWIDTPGTYVGVAFYPVCGALTSLWEAVPCAASDSVWPGDTNSDGIADLYDVLNIGIGFNNMGPIRPGASTTWIAQWAADFPQNFLNGANQKHADCDGSGIIDTIDVSAVSQNYGLVHLRRGIGGDTIDPTIPDLYVEFAVDTIEAGLMTTATVSLGRGSFQVDSVYGVAFKLAYDPDIVDENTFELNFANSWLGAGNDAIDFHQPFSGQLDIAHSRTDQVAINGDGEILTLSFYIQDNIAGKFDVEEILHFDLYDQLVISNEGIDIPVNSIGDSLLAFMTTTGIEEDEDAGVLVFPNPVSDVLFIQTRGVKIQEVELLNAIGESLERKERVNSSAFSLNVSKHPDGIYFVNLKTDQGENRRKVILK
jgi:hypothetical protein